MNKDNQTIDFHNIPALRAAITRLVQNAGLKELVFVYTFLSHSAK